ncbi:YtcA family lipoprotein [Pseudomonas kribbensis]|uniref:YtcA family lipoprotein n=1 Tax=Pseudomonas kribbensis TaxID=1628086 RepID=UPI003D7822A5
MPSFDPVRLALIPVVLLLSGCSTSPSLVLFGAAFPDWLFCIVGGVLATTAIHVILGRYSLRERISPLALSYPALTGLLAMLLWLVVFHG